MTVHISDDAMQALTGCFLGTKSSLTMHNVQSRLTPRAKAAIDELVAAGLLTATRGQGRAATYSQTDAGQAYPRKSFNWMMKQSPIQIAEPIGGDA